MCRLLILDRDKRERQFIAALASGKCDGIVHASDAKAAAKALRSKHMRPTLIVAALDAKRPDALRLLRLLHDSGSAIRVVLIVRRKAGGLVPMARRLGFNVFVGRPLQGADLEVAIREATENGGPTPTEMPSVMEDEQQTSLSNLVHHLNADMKCSAGQQQVFLHAFITGAGQKTKPRVSLRCRIRAAVGMSPYVYYEHIRDLCCGDPNKCEALQRYKAGGG